MISTAKATIHAEHRALERLRLPMSQLEAMLSAGACVRLWTASDASPKDGLLLWSPLDADFVMVWMEHATSNIVTCMPFSYSEDEFSTLRGVDGIKKAKDRARRAAVTWLLDSAKTQQQSDSGLSELTTAGTTTSAAPPHAGARKPGTPAKAPKVPKPRKPISQEVIIQLHTSRHGRKVDLPLALLGEEFVSAHPLRSQRESYLFVQAFLASAEGPEFISRTMVEKGFSLDELDDFSVQLKDFEGSQRRMVLSRTEWMTCVLDDLEHGQHMKYGPQSILELYESSFFQGLVTLPGVLSFETAEAV